MTDTPTLSYTWGLKKVPLLGGASPNKSVGTLRRWKIDLSSFETFSSLYQVTQLLEMSEVRLEPKREDSVRVQREIYRLAVPFSNQLKIWSFHVVIVQGRQRNVQKSMMHVLSFVFLIKPVGFLTLPLPSSSQTHKVPIIGSNLGAGACNEYACPSRSSK